MYILTIERKGKLKMENGKWKMENYILLLGCAKDKMRYREHFFPPSVTQACHLPHLRKAEYDKPSTASGPPLSGESSKPFAPLGHFP